MRLPDYQAGSRTLLSVHFLQSAVFSFSVSPPSRLKRIMSRNFINIIPISAAARESKFIFHTEYGSQAPPRIFSLFVFNFVPTVGSNVFTVVYIPDA